ncbi:MULTISPECIES: PIG-L family deacetylase [unclassified Streptomyces]|uniref:PIG-L family deacetylase n=1 Tax=unclassified Streptomyces TaxID=2593676 RepID=UPI0001C1C6B6|nr:MULTISPECIES: PIG-L family deacetylase [unclassified Streptomyces]AEN13067.1 LmbE family protein [Streptomyces sp. SirexAA-E]MYR67325.1 LmbE family protein [Streptomyces sp. SID4939]MYS00688.1 LmbE family protein [Streptomyces sp. SID4940]MYT67481.1 LmbE family protein [Streptomyces sp. SID8357]MYT87833.1 LmbE family protein [Streptomyces sp. SID8360]
MNSPAQPPRQASVVQILAHPDDDLYFVNPDLQRAVEAGHPIASVYLTAAEADGRNIDTRDQTRGAVPPDYSGYMAARQNGLRAAYAVMATGERDSPWSRDVVEFSAGVLAERSTLLAAPHIQLYFLGVRMVDAAHGFSPDVPPSRLATLWSGRSPVAPTLVAEDSPLRQVQELSSESVLLCLVEMMRYFRPTVVWTMDPDPQHTAWDKAKGPSSSDHQDHTATAQFALEAVDRYQRAGGVPPLVEHYRGYANKLWPSNLTETAYAEKKRLIDVYGGADGHPCTHRHCGDHQLGDGADIRRYGWSTASRYAPGTGWLRLRPDGRLAAYAVMGGRVAVWTESVPGGPEWVGPLFLQGAGLLPALTVAPDRRGSVHLVGLRRTSGPGGTAEVEVVRAWLRGEEASPWEVVGNPQGYTGDWQRCREVGVPAAVTDPAGRLHVFVRNFGFGLSARRETDEGWSDWEDLGGAGLQDAPSAVLTSTGRIEVYAPTRQGVSRWKQDAVYGPFSHDSGLLVPTQDTWRPAGGITPLQTGRSRMSLFYREEESAEIREHRQQPGPGGWPAEAESLGGAGGTGPVAALRRLGEGHDAIVLARRNAAGGVGVAVLANDRRRGVPLWEESRFLTVGAPSLAADCQGRVVTAVVGIDGRLRVRRQGEPFAESGFADWTTV